MAAVAPNQCQCVQGWRGDDCSSGGGYGWCPEAILLCLQGGHTLPTRDRCLGLRATTLSPCSQLPLLGCGAADGPKPGMGACVGTRRQRQELTGGAGEGQHPW